MPASRISGRNFCALEQTNNPASIMVICGANLARLSCKVHTCNHDLDFPAAPFLQRVSRWSSSGTFCSNSGILTATMPCMTCQATGWGCTCSDVCASLSSSPAGPSVVGKPPADVPARHDQQVKVHTLFDAGHLLGGWTTSTAFPAFTKIPSVLPKVHARQGKR